MSSPRPGPHTLHGLPTLTEVIEMPAPARGASSADDKLPLAAASVVDRVAQGGLAGPVAAPVFDEAQWVERVLTDLQRHCDLMLEYRLREALAPVLARLTEGLLRELRQELATALRDVVAHAVSQELTRQREREH